MATDARKPRPPRRGYRLVECDGEAHSNPFIDNCATCAPRWGWIEIPEEYQTLDEYRAALDANEVPILGTGAIGRKPKGTP